MIPISVEQFVIKYLKSNPDVNKEQITSSLKRTLKRKKSGAKCMYCRQTIWAIGSAVVGWDGCFPCITGEADDSDDYEVR